MTREQIIVKAVKDYVCEFGDIDYEQILDTVEDLDIFRACVDIYGYQEFKVLWVYKNKQNNTYLFLEEGEEESINFDAFVEKNKTPFESLGVYVYVLSHRRDERDDDFEYEYEVEMSEM